MPRSRARLQGGMLAVTEMHLPSQVCEPRMYVCPEPRVEKSESSRLHRFLIDPM